jgi:hypothetical protein
MLVGLPRPDLHNDKTRQVNGHQSSEIAPLPTGILGRLRRVPVLGVASKEIDAQRGISTFYPPPCAGSGAGTAKLMN